MAGGKDGGLPLCSYSSRLLGQDDDVGEAKDKTWPRRPDALEERMITMNIEIMTLGGTKRTLDATTVAGLRARARGPVLTAADAGYDAARQTWNAIIDQRPALIVRCAGAADDGAEGRSNRVSTCIRPEYSFLDRSSGAVSVHADNPKQDHLQDSAQWRHGHVAVVVAVDLEQGNVALAEENNDSQPWQNPQAFARQIRLFEVGGRYTLLDVSPTASRNAEGGRIAGWLYPLAAQ